jgi:hypothetical protein
MGWTVDGLLLDQAGRERKEGELVPAGGERFGDSQLLDDL